MFKLVRYFSITSLVAFICVAFLLSLFYRQILLNDLMVIAESKNVALTQAFSNSIWPRYSDFVAAASQLEMETLQASPEQAALKTAVLSEMAGLSVVKVKIYNLDGLTVFSTDPSQIGENKLGNAGYLAARAGDIASELTYRDTFSAFESVIEDRNVFASYIPIRRVGGPIEGVFEVYDDVTPFIDQIARSQLVIFGGVSLILAVLYLVLFFIVRQADRTIREQHKQLEQTAVALLAANTAKTNFLSNMSHELRTPLNGILGYAQILRRSSSLSPKDLEGVKVIQQSGNYLLTLINDLLDIAKIEAERFELVPNNLQLPEFLQKLVDLVQVRSHEKGLAFLFQPEENLPQAILVDEKRLQQVLLNLLGNAINYTDAGRIVFTVKHLEMPSPDEATLRFEVVDTGVGIAAADLEHIFARFAQAERSSVRKLGTGLGLPISQRLIEAMGSRIEVDSHLGVGSRFWFDLTIPVVSERKVIGRGEVTKVVGYEGAPKCVLIVDDEASNRNLLVDLLESVGFETAVAEDGAVALAMADRVQPDLFLVDLVMPNVDGMEVVRQLRQKRPFVKTPITVISANVRDDIQQQLSEAGGAVFMAKPVDVDNLLRLIGQQLRLNWIYDRSDLGEVGRPIQMLIPPAAETVATLHKLALAGDLAAIEDIAQQLVQSDQTWLPFAMRLQKLTQLFEDEALIAFLEQYQPTQEKNK